MSAPLPSITIAVPAYNHSRYVVQALDSMLDSGVPDVEIIVCDDASTDDTAKVVAEWGRNHGGRLSRFELLRHQRNTGLCQTLNDIVAEAQGELIHVIASDDYFLPGGILTKTRVMAEHPEWQLAFCDGQAVGPEGQTYVESIVEHSDFIPTQLVPEQMSEELFFHWGPPVHQMTWRRNTYRQHGGEFAYDPTVFCEDYDSALWAAARRILGYIPHVCQAYRCRSWPQSSDRNSIRECRDLAFILTKHARHLPLRLQQDYELLARILNCTAIGDTTQANALRRLHRTSLEAYGKRVTDPDETVPEPAPASSAEAMRRQLVRAEEENLGLKSELRRTREKLKGNQATMAELTSRLKAARHLLSHHSANPGRALKLWWNRQQPLP